MDKNQSRSTAKNMGGKKKSKGAAEKGPAAVEESHVLVSAPTFTCTICLNDQTTHAAVGVCSHAICSKCALRMRSLAKDRSCAICKASLEVVIVFDTKRITPDAKFSGFGVPAAFDDAFEGPSLPGTFRDDAAAMIYFDCRDHYEAMSHMKSIHCPCMEAKCTFTAASYPALMQHVNNHHKNVCLCQLCLENRPLFMDEHEVMTKKEFTAHMKGMDNAESPHFHDDFPNRFTAGHPRCQFCKTHFFDQTALYNHLQREHFTCHLCDSSKMFRYYQDLNGLRAHHRQSHFVCELCDHEQEMQTSDVNYAFRTVGEFTHHMRDVHALRDSHQRYLVTGKQHVSSASNTATTYYDLDVGSANPYNPTQSQAVRAPGSQQQQQHHSHRGQESNPSVQLIPPNMRVAGRISGTGRLFGPDSSDLAMQAMSESAYRAAAQRNRFIKPAKMTEQSFPSLPSSGASRDALDTVVIEKVNAAEDGVMMTTTSQVLHPMSLVNRPSPASTATTSNNDCVLIKQVDADNKRVARNVALAEAFGIAGSRSLSTEVVGATVSHESYRQAIIHALAMYRLPTQILFTPLFPVEMLSWARKNANELNKVERKITALLQDSKSLSLSLKPMKAADRLMMHCLARYYNLHSYEYDAEPQRYVSMVKVLQSAAPSVLLSQACMSTVWTPTKLTMTSPTIYLTVADGLVQIWGRQTDRKAPYRPLAFTTSAMLIGEMLMQIKTLFGSALSEDMNVAQCGPAAIGLRFSSLNAADFALKVMNEAFETAQDAIGALSSVNAVMVEETLNHCAPFPFYRIHADFEPVKPAVREGEQTEDIPMPVQAPRQQSNHSNNDDWSTLEEYEIIQSADGWDDTALSSAAAAVAAPDAARADSPEGLRPGLPPGVTADDDWEDVADNTEWEEFLAERRNRVQSSNKEVYRPPRDNATGRSTLDSTAKVAPVEAQPFEDDDEEEVQSSSAAASHQKDDDFALAMALQRQEEEGAYVARYGHNGEWRQIGKPTALSAGSTVSGAVHAKVGAENDVRGLVSTVAMAIPVASPMTAIAAPEPRSTTVNAGPTRKEGQGTAPAKGKANNGTGAKNKFNALMEDEDDD